MKKALLVGINDYQNAALKCCINDAQEVSKLLERNEDGSKNFDIVLMNDVKDKSSLKQLISKLFSGQEETALFYFSGHGCINEYGGYIVTPDYEKYDEGLSMSELSNIVNKSKIANKIIILDCCYAGAAGTDFSLDNNSSVIPNGVTIMTSCRQDEPSMETGMHGIFTELLISALKGGASDLSGDITPGGIYAYIDKSLGAWEQRPLFKTNISRFISLRKVQPQVPTSELKQIVDLFPSLDAHLQLDPSFEFTNCKEIEHDVIKPYADKENVKKFKTLQKLQSIGLVVPVDEQYMYFAAMKSKSCTLTPLGKYYWSLVNSKRI